MTWEDILKVKDMNTGEMLKVDFAKFIAELKSNLGDATLGFEGLVESGRKARFEVRKVKGSQTRPPLNNDVGCGIRVVGRNIGEEFFRYDIQVRFDPRDDTKGTVALVNGNELKLRMNDEVNGLGGLTNRIKQAIKDSVNKSRRFWYDLGRYNRKELKK